MSPGIWSGELIGFAPPQGDPLTLHGASRDVQLEHLGLLHGSLALAFLAPVLLLDVDARTLGSGRRG